MFMKFVVYLLFIVTSFSCSCLEKPLPPEKPKFPNTNLKEIVFHGTYYPENPEELEEIKRDYRERGLLKKGETLKEKYPDLLDDGDENFIYSGMRYCYNKIKTEDRKPVFKDNLKARLYDKEGNLLTEDFLRLWYPDKYDKEGRYSEDYLRRHYTRPPGALETPEHLRMTPEDGLLESRALIAYIPYDERGYEIRIVRLEGRKEVILHDKIKPYSQLEIQKKTGVDFTQAKTYRHSWTFNKDSQCHVSPYSELG